MKKSLLALAVLGAFAGVASAQSSVVIYGTVDQAFGRSNGGNATAPNSYGSTKSYQINNFGHQSRIGFRGNEDLGGGLSAQFQIENRFNPDTGAQANAGAWWQGMSYVQLTSKAAGSVWLGRWYPATFKHFVKLDPFAWDGIGRMGDYQYGNYGSADAISVPAGVTCNGNGVNPTTLVAPANGCSPGASTRTSNTVGYESPNWGGFFARGTAALSETSSLGRVMSVGGGYEAGPVYVGLTAEKVYKGTFHDQSIYSVGGTYDLGVTKLFGLFARSNYNLSGPFSNAFTHTIGGVTGPGGANGLTYARVYEIGAVTPLGGGALKAGYIRVNPRGVDNTRQKFAVGYDYFLSKRTKVYLDTAYIREDRRTNNKAFSLGVRHDF